MTVSDADAQCAADRWAEIVAGGTFPSNLPGYVARKVVGEDLRASGVLAADEQWPAGMWQQLCDELLPRDGRLMGSREDFEVTPSGRDLLDLLDKGTT